MADDISSDQNNHINKTFQWNNERFQITKVHKQDGNMIEIEIRAEANPKQQLRISLPQKTLNHVHKTGRDLNNYNTPIRIISPSAETHTQASQSKSTTPSHTHTDPQNSHSTSSQRNSSPTAPSTQNQNRSDLPHLRDNSPESIQPTTASPTTTTSTNPNSPLTKDNTARTDNTDRPTQNTADQPANTSQSDSGENQPQTQSDKSPEAELVPDKKPPNEATDLSDEKKAEETDPNQTEEKTPENPVEPSGEENSESPNDEKQDTQIPESRAPLPINNRNEGRDTHPQENTPRADNNVQTRTTEQSRKGQPINKITNNIGSWRKNKTKSQKNNPINNIGHKAQRPLSQPMTKTSQKKKKRTGSKILQAGQRALGLKKKKKESTQAIKKTVKTAKKTAFFEFVFIKYILIGIVILLFFITIYMEYVDQCTLGIMNCPDNAVNVDKEEWMKFRENNYNRERPETNISSE